MALFRKFFYRKPPDGLLEICERVYVFDCCYCLDTFEEEEYKVYMGSIVHKLRDHLPDASFMVFNFREGESQSQIASILSEFDMTVMDYPRHYESCPLLSMEMIHHFLRSSESWLSLGQQNVVLMHCERGGWPILAFMLAAFLLYGKQFTGEQRTLEMIYKQGPRELLQLMSPLNPLPSQLRYLQYVSRRNVGAQWPPLDRALTLDCIILRAIPSMDAEGGCRPIFRIYGQDPFMAADRTPKVLFSTPKRSKLVRHYKQEDCELIKIDIHCHVQGDVVMECISLDSDREREQMMFRVMFNTAFIRSNILMLTRDEIDMLWNAKDQFPKDFRAEVLLSEMDSAPPVAAIDLPGIEEKDGLPMEAFARVHEIFSNVEWPDTKTDVSQKEHQNTDATQENLENLDSSTAWEEKASGLMESTIGKIEEKPKIIESENNTPSPTSITLAKQSIPSLKPFPDTNSLREKTEPQELKVALQSMPSVKSSPGANSASEKLKPQEQKVALQSSKPDSDADSTQKQAQSPELQAAQQRSAQAKIRSQQVRQGSFPPQVSTSNSLQGSPTPVSRYHSAPSALGITALLHDHAASKGEEVVRPVTVSLPLSAISSPLTTVTKSTQLNNVSTLRTRPPPTPLQSSIGASKTAEKPSPSCPIPQDISISSPVADVPEPAQVNHGCAPQRSQPPPSPLQSSIEALTSTEESSAATPVPPQTILNETDSLLNQHPEATSGSIRSPSVPPPPPPLPYLPAYSSPGIESSSSAPPAPPPPPSTAVASLSPALKKSFSTPTPLSPPPPPPPGIPPSSASRNSYSAPPSPPPGIASLVASSVTSSDSVKNSAVVPGPPPPPPPLHSRSVLGRTGSVSVPPPPPPPPPPASSAAKPSATNNTTHIPPVPPPPAPLAKGLSRTSGVSSQSHAGVSNGNVPSVPLPPSAPFGAKGRGILRTSSKNQAQPRKANLKPYHWLKLTRAMSGSLWAEAQKADEASKAPEFDISELETLFSAAAPSAEHASSGRKSNRRTLGPKSDKVQLIELRRAYNCEIMLSKVKIPLSELMSSVLVLDDTALDVDQVDNLIKFCPTKEEMELLKGYNGDKENLGKCEQFFLEMMKVPRAESKLRVFSFKIQFQSQVSDLRRNLNIVNSASEEIRSSAKLRRIMQTILSLGNALNHGTARGSAVGFRLDSLLKLTDTRSQNKKLTLMHYLCKVVAAKLPELLDFPKDLVNLEAATKIQLKYLAEEMQAISKGLEKVMQELTASENDGLVSESFCKTLKNFLTSAESEVRSLASLYSSVGRNADALALYFGEDPARCPFEQVVSTLLNFVRMFVRAHDENQKQLEYEKKRAEKAADEKSQLASPPKRLSQNLAKTPIRSGTIK